MTETLAVRALPDVVELNPRRFAQQPNDDDLVSFVPMRAVAEESGLIDGREVRPWTEVKKGYTAFQDGDVIVAKITPCMENGKFALASALHGGRAAGSTEFHVLRAKPSLLPKYLLHFVFTPEIRRAAKMNMKGAAGQLRVPIQFFEGLKIPVPSLDEQHKVVAYLDEQLSRLDASVAALRRVQANLKRYHASVLKAACEGHLAPTEAELARREGRDFETGAQLLQRVLVERRRTWVSKRQYVEPTTVAQSEIPPLPEGWTSATLEQLAWHSSYGTSAKCSPTGSGAAVLRIPNVDEGNIDTTDMKYSDEALDPESTAALKSGDMLIIRTNGSKALIGRGALVRKAFTSPTTFASYLIRFRLMKEIHQEWLALFWQSPAARGWIEARASTSAGQHNVSMSVLATAPIPLPPLAEQHRIVAEADRRLSLIRTAEAQVSANLARAQRLRQSILQAAFATPA